MSCTMDYGGAFSPLFTGHRWFICLRLSGDRQNKETVRQTDRQLLILYSIGLFRDVNQDKTGL